MVGWQLIAVIFIGLMVLFSADHLRAIHREPYRIYLSKNPVRFWVGIAATIFVVAVAAAALIGHLFSPNRVGLG